MKMKKKAITLSTNTIIILTLVLLFIFVAAPLMGSSMLRLLGVSGGELCKLSLYAPKILKIKECPAQYSRAIIDDANNKFQIDYKAKPEDDYKKIISLPSDAPSRQKELDKYVADKMEQCYSISVECWPCHYLYDIKVKKADLTTLFQATGGHEMSYIEYLNYSSRGIGLNEAFDFDDNSESMVIMFLGDDYTKYGGKFKDRVVLMSTKNISIWCTGLYE
jgi:hypothetical protein